MIYTYDYTNWFEKDDEESADTTLKRDTKENFDDIPTMLKT